jgi:hypothetical protein
MLWSITPRMTKMKGRLTKAIQKWDMTRNHAWDVMPSKDRLHYIVLFDFLCLLDSGDKLWGEGGDYFV